MDTTPNQTGDPAPATVPDPPDPDDDVAAMTAMDPAEAPEAAEELARRLAAELDADSVPLPSDRSDGTPL